MNWLGWVAAIVLGLCVYLQAGELRGLRADVNTAKSALSAERRLSAELRRIGAAQAQIEGELMNGGEDGLSDYMSGAASKLWP